jgi:hypothetical protein
VKNRHLYILPERLAICRLAPNQAIPPEITLSPFFSITRTDEELSIVVPEEWIPNSCQRSEMGWRYFKVQGPLDFTLVGILSSLTTLLAQEGISVFAISTYDTDYLLVKESELEKSQRILSANGYEISGHILIK